VRVTTALNRMLRLPGAWVRDVAFCSHRDGRLAPQAAGVLVVRGARAAGQGAPRQAMAASRSRRRAVRDRMLAQTALLPGVRGSARGGAVGQGGVQVHARFRGHVRVAGAADEPDADHPAAAGRVEVGREDRRPGGRRQARHRPAGRTGDDRLRRDRLRCRSPLPDLRRRPRHGRDRVGRAGSQRRDLAAILRPAHRRAEGVDPGGLDRYVGRI
jgi:hypothetical protein